DGPRALAGGGDMRLVEPGGGWWSKMPVVLFAAMCISGCGKSTPRQRGSRAGSDQALTIAVIPKGTTHEFWKRIHAGAIQALGELIGGKGKVLLLRDGEGSASTTERESGFLEVFRSRYPGIEIVSADQYAGPTRETAKRASENLLNRYGGLVQGIFTPNESSTIGMLLALQDIGLAGKAKVG